MYTLEEVLDVVKQKLDVPDDAAKRIGEALVQFANEVTEAERKACARIAVDYAIAAGSGLEAHAGERIARIILSRGRGA